MRCRNCDYYSSGYMHNSCLLAETECFREMDDCDLVNDDMTVNYNNVYFDGIANKPEDDPESMDFDDHIDCFPLQEV